ncbi:hypothetical protein CBR_g37213 [Chara braunii]|uniref:Protein kinase domain-containing protein n=1 Tax=Chara braunii TaxID=69332 RepID=A0A388LME9_CHABU|nr:hypothetical protein CBR_g37213 [Chara braunii]|eukprot:GBG83499.1 hypothetical protein CBR_g37213 [Chara braunii]
MMTSTFMVGECDGSVWRLPDTTKPRSSFDLDRDASWLGRPRRRPLAERMATGLCGGDSECGKRGAEVSGHREQVDADSATSSLIRRSREAVVIMEENEEEGGEERREEEGEKGAEERRVGNVDDFRSRFQVEKGHSNQPYGDGKDGDREDLRRWKEEDGGRRVGSDAGYGDEEGLGEIEREAGHRGQGGGGGGGGGRGGGGRRELEGKSLVIERSVRDKDQVVLVGRGGGGEGRGEGGRGGGGRGERRELGRSTAAIARSVAMSRTVQQALGNGGGGGGGGGGGRSRGKEESLAAIEEEEEEEEEEVEGRELRGSGDVMEKSVTDESLFQEALREAHLYPAIVLRFEADVVLTKDLPMVVSTANVTLQGQCSARPCIIWGQRVIFSNHTYGSLQVYDLKFMNISVIFHNSNLTMRNCVFENCTKFQLTYLPRQVPNPRSLRVDNCTFLNNVGGIVFSNVGDVTCISNSKFISYQNDAPALAMNIMPGYTGRDREVRVSNSLFKSTKGGVYLSFSDPGCNIDVVFKDTAFVSRQLDVRDVTVVLNSSSASSGSAALDGHRSAPPATPGSVDPNWTGNGTGIPTAGTQRLRLCRATFSYEAHEALPPFDVEVRLISGPRLDLELCANDSVAVPRVEGPGTALNITTNCTSCEPGTPCVLSYKERIQRDDDGQINKGLLAAIIVSISVLVVVSSGVFFFLLKGVRREGFMSKKNKLAEGSQSHHHAHLQRLHIFDLKSLQAATENFSNKIGEGGSAIVYRGKLRTGDEVAVKGLKAGYWRSEREFVHEVNLLGKLSHKNLVMLKGYCIENNRFFLVYEFVHRGTLHSYIHKNSKVNVKLDWGARFKIASEVASALEYLHHSLENPLVHRDIKPGNVLLTTNFTAKVADFGLCRMVELEDASDKTQPAGTPGYIPPEIFSGEGVSEKVDVYSFGVVILELLTGKHAVHRNFSLIKWVASNVEDADTAILACDPVIQDNADPGQIFLMMKIAMRCVDDDPETRPTMKNVVRAFEKMAPFIPESPLMMDTDINSETSIDTPRGRLIAHRGMEWSSSDETHTNAKTRTSFGEVVLLRILRLGKVAGKLESFTEIDETHLLVESGLDTEGGDADRGPREAKNNYSRKGWNAGFERMMMIFRLESSDIDPREWRKFVRSWGLRFSRSPMMTGNAWSDLVADLQAAKIERATTAGRHAKVALMLLQQISGSRVRIPRVTCSCNSLFGNLQRRSVENVSFAAT